MKRTVVFVLVIVMLCALCAGCDAWTGGEYLSVTPHEAQSEVYSDRVIEVTSYTQLRNAVSNLVSAGAENGIISISAFNKGTIHFYVDTAIEKVIDSSAFGAYAVEEITYEIGTNRGVSVVALDIHYRSGYRQLSEIVPIENAEALSETIMKALDNSENSVLVRMEQYEALDVAELVSEYALMHPERVPEIPTVAVEVYPEFGAERIVEISFGYITDQILLQQMRGKIEDGLRAAEESVTQTADAEEICRQLRLYMTSQFSYRMNDSVTPVYNLLINGEGNHVAFAAVFARLCNRFGINGGVVSGTRNGEQWTWNRVEIRGRQYYLDLLDGSAPEAFLLRTAEQMTGYLQSN